MRVDLTACDRHITAVSVLTAADTGALFSCGSGDRAAGDSDVASVSVFTAADARAVYAADSKNFAAGDIDSTAVAAFAEPFLTAADTCRIFAAVRPDVTLSDGDRT